MTKGRKESKTKQTRKKSKKNSIFSVVLMIVGVVGILSVYSDVIRLDDSKMEPLLQTYLIKQITDMGVKQTILPDGNITDTYFMTSNMDSFSRLEGAILFDTTSKSAKNPINITIKLIPDPDISLLTDWKDMPENIHFTFPNAKKWSEKDIVIFKDFVDVKLEKFNEPYPYYFGNEIVYYEDAGQYDFYLKEAKEQEHNVTITEKEDGNLQIKLHLDVNNDSSQLGTRIYAIDKYENQKLTIESYSQTITLNNYKNTGYFGFTSVLISGCLALIKYR